MTPSRILPATVAFLGWLAVTLVVGIVSAGEAESCDVQLIDPDSAKGHWCDADLGEIAGPWILVPFLLVAAVAVATLATQRRWVPRALGVSACGVMAGVFLVPQIGLDARCDVAGQLIACSYYEPNGEIDPTSLRRAAPLVVRTPPPVRDGRLALTSSRPCAGRSGIGDVQVNGHTGWGPGWTETIVPKREPEPPASAEIERIELAVGAHTLCVRATLGGKAVRQARLAVYFESVRESQYAGQSRDSSTLTVALDRRHAVWSRPNAERLGEVRTSVRRGSMSLDGNVVQVVVDADRQRALADPLGFHWKMSVTTFHPRRSRAHRDWAWEQAGSWALYRPGRAETW